MALDYPIQNSFYSQQWHIMKMGIDAAWETLDFNLEKIVY